MSMRFPSLISFLILYYLTPLVFVYSLQFYHAGNNDTDMLALREFKASITDDPLGILTSWNDSLHFCDWFGVTCGRQHRRVRALNLDSSKLTGNLSPFIGNLSFLRVLNLSINSFIGTIPPEIGRLHRLQYLGISNNLVGGNIPRNLSLCRNLNYLGLHYNMFVGEIPAELGSLKNLQYLALSTNNLTGVIPSSLGNLTSLSELFMYENNLIGTIPESLGRLNQLTLLALAANKLSGVVPPSIFNLSFLAVLDLRINQLEGILPLHIGTMLPNLQFLSIGKNKFTGVIPSSLANLTSLSVLSMTDNNLTGTIPESLGSLNQLTLLEISLNKLSGVVPPSIFNLSLLTILDLGYNQLLEGILPQHIGAMLPNLQLFSIASNNFNGSIPASINNCTSLAKLQLNTNSFQGQAPCLQNLQSLEAFSIYENQLGLGQLNDLDFVSCFTNSTMLTILFINDNNFQGAFPSAICNLSILSTFTIGANRIQGEIPSCVENLANLQVFDAGNNKLSGVIPFNIGKLQNLRTLVLTSNQLSGYIPSSVGNLTQLSRLYLNDNNLKGHIPSTMGKCKVLVELQLSSNNLTGRIPTQLFNLSLSIGLDLSHNSLMGPLPKEVGQLKNRVGLDISYNRLSGEIPSNLGDCLPLEKLYMNGNHFQGVIPPTFAALRGLRELDLSGNNLSGEVPNFLVNFPLQLLNLSYNNLEGEVPVGGVFNNKSRLDIVGNSGLCGGMRELNLLPCKSEEGKKRTFSVGRRLIIIIVSGVFGVGLMVASASLYVFCLRKKTIESKGRSETPFLNLSYGDILKATNEFASENLVGSGTFGTVYKAILDQDRKIVAIKTFNLVQRGGYKSFMAECQILRNVRHRNLVKVITACSSVDYKGNDFKALVYEYMSNGSLEDWLHQNQIGIVEGTSAPLRILNLFQRFDIAVDLAFALEYLHYHSGASIIHCDLKPSNVLLDDDIIAHVGDFGLAKFISNGIISSHANESSSIAVRGTIGYAPPEYGLGNEPSTQGDVYSFGILLMEMFTGKKPTDGRFKDGLNLYGYVKAFWPERVMEIFDHAILEDIVGEEQMNTKTTEHTDYLLRTGKSKRMLEAVTSVLGIALSCSAEYPGERMDMRDVVAKLSAERNKLLGTRLPRQRQLPAGEQ